MIIPLVIVPFIFYNLIEILCVIFEHMHKKIYNQANDYF